MQVDKALCREAAARIRIADIEGHFDMEVWGRAEMEDEWWLKDQAYNECNTVACAAGHVLMAAGYMPQFSGVTFKGYRKPGESLIEEGFARRAANLLGVYDEGIFYSTQFTADQVSKYFDLLADGWGWKSAHNQILTMGNL